MTRRDLSLVGLAFVLAGVLDAALSLVLDHYGASPWLLLALAVLVGVVVGRVMVEVSSRGRSKRAPERSPGEI